ncbi:MAG TPA: rhamnulokinase [Candidatus Hydrogenedentes bacterium]|nr:rhamnulokinase [Candidatus Hydrogenedentota bacterium]
MGDRESAAPPRYLAFDLGAESSRAIVGTFGPGEVVLEELHRFPSKSVLVGNTRYWDILYFFAEFKEALLKYAAKYGPNVEGIGVDTWGVDFGLIGPSGQLLSNPVHYRDHRTDGILDEAFEVVPRETLYQRTGIQFMPLNSLYQFWAARRTTPELLREARVFLLMPDLFHYFLTGIPCSEYTIASTTQMLDVHRRQWSASLFHAFGIPMNIAPRIIEPCTVIGPLDAALAQEAGLDPATRVIAPCAHDTASAVAAVPAEDRQWIYISCGTWSLMGAELPEPITSEKALKYNFTNEGGIRGTIRFLKNIMGLWVLQECRAAWAKRGETYDYAELTDRARGAEPFETLLDVDAPLFLNPDDMLDAIAEYCRATGQRAPRTVGGAVRAVLEGLALCYALTLEELEDTIGIAPERIHMVGGGTQNELLCQLASDATGRPVIAGPVEATAMGNLIAQAMATGRIADLSAARRLVAQSTQLTTYQPTNTAAWRPVLERFRQMRD